MVSHLNRVERIARENIKKIHEWMENDKIDLVFLCDPPNIRYAIGIGPYMTRTMFESAFSEYVLFSKDDELPAILVNFYQAFYRERVRWVSHIGSMDELESYLRGLSRVKRVVTSTETPNYIIERMKGVLSDATITADASDLEKIRSIKSDHEIANISDAAEIAMAMMQKARAACREGARECDVAAEAEHEMRKLGADTFAFSTIVSSGFNLGVMQEIATEKRIQSGETVMVDLGATRNSYNAEFTRTFAIGSISNELRTFYRVVHEALLCSIDKIQPGQTCHIVDKTARDIVKRSGHDYAHFTGHGIGTSVWEYPTVATNSVATLEPNMVIALEPAIYKPGVGGVRLEHNLVVTKNHPKILTPFPFEEELL